VDLTSLQGCEVTPDVSLVALTDLQAVQHRFLRRALNLGDHSMLAPLFTGTALVPIRYRRVELTQKYMAYLISLPNSKHAEAAYLGSLTLFREGQSCWLRNVVLVLSRLPEPVIFDPLTRLPKGDLMGSRFMFLVSDCSPVG
jgi:hypothetical protein